MVTRGKSRTASAPNGGLTSSILGARSIINNLKFKLMLIFVLITLSLWILLTAIFTIYAISTTVFTDTSEYVILIGSIVMAMASILSVIFISLNL